MKTFKKLLIILSAITLTACNTIAGIGKDISGGATWTKEKVTGSSN